MKKLFPETPDVPQRVANRGVRIIERHFRKHKVERASDLSEEAKIRLLRDLDYFFETELRSEGASAEAAVGVRASLARFWERVQDFLQG